jgi:predicted small metal-binding protein
MSNREEETLTKSFACADGGIVCRGEVTGESDEEVLAKAAEHLKQKHGLDLSVSRTLAAYAKSLLKDEAAVRGQAA